MKLNIFRSLYRAWKYEHVLAERRKRLEAAEQDKLLCEVLKRCKKMYEVIPYFKDFVDYTGTAKNPYEWDYELNNSKNTAELLMYARIKAVYGEDLSDVVIHKIHVPKEDSLYVLGCLCNNKPSHIKEWRLYYRAHRKDETCELDSIGETTYA